LICWECDVARKRGAHDTGKSSISLVEMKPHEKAHPVDIGLLSPQAVTSIAKANTLAELVKQPDGLQGYTTHATPAL
jgi:hypothetical protein